MKALLRELFKGYKKRRRENMDNESLAQIGESYIQAQQEQERKREEQQQKQEWEQQQQEQESCEDEFDVKILGNVVCQVTDIIFSRMGWEKLRAEEKQLLGDSFVGVVRKRVPGIISWSNEVNLGIAIAMIIITRISTKNKIEKYEEGYKDEGEGRSSNSSNLRAQGRGKKLFPR